ncbi:MAG: threonine synthase [Spirochaetaceae bacterium]
MSQIMFYSTNGDSPLVNFEDALLNGIAPDKGLYMPESIPQLSNELIESFKDMEYHEVAYHVTKSFIGDLVSDDDLKFITKDAYNYDVPLENVFERKYIMRLDQGPTASFKDFAARMMARLMQHFLKKDDKKLLILVATSGDTGSAIANAYYGLDNIKVLVLFPETEVSERQRKQMTTLKKNISTLALQGKFDDCQALVKQAFVDDDLKYLNLSSANSINFGRLLPQTVYYFWAYSRLAKAKEKITFSIPSGNFGDMMGAVIASRMGLPIEKLVISTNSNDEFPKFVKTGNYNKIEPSIACVSNAMNVGHPSNLPRLINLFGGQMDEKGNIGKTADMEKLRRFIYTISVDDETTKETIVEAYKKYNVILEQHGAVGWKGLTSYLEENDDPDKLFVSVETAHPAKFPSEIIKLIGIDPELPPSLQGIEDKEESFDRIGQEYKSFKEYLKKNYGVSL